MAFVLGLGCLTARISAHDCGPAQIEIKAGRSYFWRIKADLTEKLTRYTPTLTGAAGVAEVFPRKVFDAHHGDFVITGLQPGTNQLTVRWFYEPTGADRNCAVTIIVRPDDGVPDFQTQSANGELVTRAGEPAISAVQLDSLINSSIPAEALKLLVFAQCFGGNLALSPLFKDDANTAISSGTSPNQEGRYGGFHDDAARGLRPAAGRTALDLHDEGSAGKSTVWVERSGSGDTEAGTHQWSEWPRMSGGLPLSQFPLDPVTAEGAVRSRHIVIFAGRPGSIKEEVLTQGTITIPDETGTRQVFSDNADRDQIKANFAGQANTTVRTCGGEPSWQTAYNPFADNAGTDGWDFPGDLDGLQRAIKEAGDAIRNSPDPSKEQFILYVTDHGERGVPLPTGTTTVAPNSSGTLGSGIATPASNSPLSGSLQRQPDNQPQLRVQVKPGGGQSPNRGAQRAGSPVSVNPGDVELRLTPEGGVPVTLLQPRVSVVDLDDDGNLASLPGEGIWLHFPIPEPQLLTNIFGRALTIVAANRSGQPLEFSDLTLLTGGIASDNADPEPHVIGFRQVDAAQVEFTVGGLPNRRYLFEASADLTAWNLITDRALTGYTETLTVSVPPNAGQVFMRVRKPEP